MSIAAFPVSETAISEPPGTARGKRPPPARQIVPKPDARNTAEPR